MLMDKKMFGIFLKTGLQCVLCFWDGVVQSLDEQLEMFGDRFNKISARVSMAASELEADEVPGDRKWLVSA